VPDQGCTPAETESLDNVNKDLFNENGEKMEVVELLVTAED
jgi:hypothetical protein